jgi:hypothetical protein
MTAAHLYKQENLPSDVPTYISQHNLPLDASCSKIVLGNYMWDQLSSECKEEYTTKAKELSLEDLKGCYYPSEIVFSTLISIIKTYFSTKIFVQFSTGISKKL